MTAAEFAAVLDARKIHAGEWVGKCPAHDDRTPSLKITDAGDRTLICCHAGCRNAAIVRAVGLRLADLFTKPLSTARRRRMKPPPVARRDPDLGRVLRDEIYARHRVETYAQKLLTADPVSEAGWEALRVAYRGLAETEWELDRLEGRQ